MLFHFFLAITISGEKTVLIRTVQFSSVQLFSHVQLFVTPWTAARQASLCFTNPRTCSNSCPLSRWCHPTNSSSVLFSCLQSFPASGSFLMSQLLASGGQSIGVSASASVLQMNIQDWFPLGWTGLISLKSKGLSRVFSSTTVQSIISLELSFLYNPTLTSIHDYWKNRSFNWVAIPFSRGSSWPRDQTLVSCIAGGFFTI